MFHFKKVYEKITENAYLLYPAWERLRLGYLPRLLVLVYFTSILWAPFQVEYLLWAELYSFTIRMLAPQPRMWLHLETGYEEVIKVKWGHKDGFLVLLRRDTRALASAVSLPAPSPPAMWGCEDTLRRWPSASQEERPHQEPIGGHPDLGLPASSTVRKQLLCTLPSLWNFVNGSLGRRIQGPRKLGPNRITLDADTFCMRCGEQWTLAP